MSSAVLDDVQRLMAAMPEKKRKQLKHTALKETEKMVWVPNPGPQTQAYFSKADVLLYGGEPGGGKSSLLLGLAFNCHQRSLIMRRQYTDLGAVLEEALKMNSGRDGYNGSPPPSLRRKDGRLIDFGAALRLGDEQHWQGNPHDLLGLDEGTQFAYVQLRFLMGWLRSTVPGQRKRVVIASNPPLTADGLWVLKMFAPWLDDRHPKPAVAGELRWFITDGEGNDTEVIGPQDTMVINGKVVEPLSRTFIPASVNDNPFLRDTGYQKQLDAMIEPYRSILLGKFKTTLKDAPNQVIPTEWIRMAQSRWQPNPPEGVPMCSMGVDASGGGEDPMVIAPRYDGWYATLIEIPGKDMPMESLGRTGAGHVIANRRDQALVIVDLGGGYGGSMYEHLNDNNVSLIGFKGAEASTRRTSDKKMKFTNKRSAAWWALREALDPGQPGGSPIALPEDTSLVADLTSPTFEVTPNGIKVEPKEDVVARLGRSTDHGDAVVMAWSDGAKAATATLDWIQRREEQGLGGHRPKVMMGRQEAKRHGQLR